MQKKVQDYQKKIFYLQFFLIYGMPKFSKWFIVVETSFFALKRHP